MKKFFILILVLCDLGLHSRPGFSSEDFTCLAPQTVLENQKEILASVQSRLSKARRMIERKKNYTVESLKRIDFKDLNLRFLNMGNEYYVFFLQEYPHLVFKIPRSLHPLCYPVQYVNMKLIELSLQSKGKVKSQEIDGFSLISIPGFMPYLFSSGMIIQEKAEVILEDDEAMINRLVDTVEENGIMDLDPTGGNIGVVNRETEPEPLFIDMGLVNLRDRELMRTVNQTDPLRLLKNRKNIDRFILSPRAIFSENRDTLFYSYMVLDLNPHLILSDVLELMTSDEALISYYYYQALLDHKSQDEALEESFQFYCLYKKERGKRLKSMEQDSMAFLKELLKSA